MMGKNIVILILLIITVIGCDKKKDNTNVQGEPVMLIENKTFDFGEVQRGEMLAHTFIVKNIGDGELLISNVETDCGCIIVDFDREPIQPNEETSIEVIFDSDGMAGLQIKKFKVYSNANKKPSELVISAMVQYQLEEGI